MNIKTKAIVEDLLILINQMQAEMQPRGLGQHLIGKIEQLTKKGQDLINPPVKFLWTRRAINVYRANIGTHWYQVERKKQADSVIRWSAYVWTAEYMADGKFIHSGLPTLAQAKQACVDYGVANYKKPEA